MVMETTALYQAFKKVPKVTDEQAHIIASVIARIDDVATKADVKEMLKDTVTKDDIKDMVVKDDIKDMVAQADLRVLRSNMKALEFRIVEKSTWRLFISTSIIIAAVGLMQKFL